jgi:hypothetical protein
MSDSSSMKWHQVDPPAANALTAVTNRPGPVYTMGSNQLPTVLQQIPGVSSYFVSGYSSNPICQNVTIGGEMLVARSDQALTKNYQYLFGTSSNGQVCFAGPFKNFQGHHISSGQQVEITCLFGHTPFSSK